MDNHEMSAILMDWYFAEDDIWTVGGRDAVCKWMVENPNMWRKVLPSGYPKRLTMIEDAGSVGFAVIAVNVLGVVLAIVGGLAVVKNRETTAIRFSQPNQMLLSILGCAILLLGGVAFGLGETNAVCA